MKKRGFTLVELLAVIAILAILVIIALPNVIKLFNSSKESTFITEAKRIYRGSEQAYVKDAFNSSGSKIYSKCKNGCTRELDMSIRDNLEYYIEIDSQGKIIKYYITDGDYQYSYDDDNNGLKISEINNVQKVADLNESERIVINESGPYIGKPKVRYKLVTNRGSFSTSSTLRSVYVNSVDDDYEYNIYTKLNTSSNNNFGNSKLAIKVYLAKANCFTDSSYYRIYWTYQGHHDLKFELKKSDLPEHRYNIENNKYLDSDYREYNFLDAGFGYNRAAITVEQSDDIKNCRLVDTSFYYFDDFKIEKSYSGPWLETTAFQNYINILNNSVSDYYVSGVSICNSCSEKTLNIEWSKIEDVNVCYFSTLAGISVNGVTSNITCKNYQTASECLRNIDAYNNKENFYIYSRESSDCNNGHNSIYCQNKGKLSYNVVYMSDLVKSDSNGCYSNAVFVTCLSGDMEIEVYDRKKKKRVKKKLKDITYDDLVLAWDFDKGDYVWAEVLWIMRQTKANSYYLLTFSDGSILKVVEDHRIFSCEKNRFVSCVKFPINSTTINSKGEIIELVSRKVVNEEVDVCNIITKNHINVFANGLLTSRGRNNIYPIENMKYVKDKHGETFKREDFPEISDEYYYGLRFGDTSKNYIGNEKITRDSLVLLVERLENLKENRK